MRRIRTLIIAIAFAGALSASTTASAAYVYVVGSAAQRGVGAARLDMADNTAASKIGISLSSYRPNPWLNTNYAGRRVYVWRFGTKMSNGRYPVMMYANDDAYDKVFHFTINSSAYKTPSGISVGSTPTYLKTKYPQAVLYRGSVYYTLRIKYGSGRPYTDFNYKPSVNRIDHINIYK